jgi:hypothetical protein
MLQGESQKMSSPKEGAPDRLCTTCNKRMEHLADLPEAGAQPAKRVFLCRSCKNVVSEAQ